MSGAAQPAKRVVPCSLVVNVASSDTPILQHTIPHMLASHQVRFAEVVLVIDGRPPQGRIRHGNEAYSLDQLYQAVDALRATVDLRMAAVDYAPTTVERTFTRWFGHGRVSLVCAGGTPIYQFLFGLDQACNDFRLHLDSDMLIRDPGPQSWVERAMEVLAAFPQVMFVSQAGGPHAADCPRREHIPPYDPATGLHLDQSFSTRAFLYSQQKLARGFLPLRAARHPALKQVKYFLQGRSPHMALEQMVARSLARRGCYHCDLDRSYGFSLHAGDKGAFSRPEMPAVLERVSAGDVPLDQCGKYDLDFQAFAAPEMPVIAMYRLGRRAIGAR